MEHLITVSVNSPSAGVLKYRGRHLAGRHASLPARGQTRCETFRPIDDSMIESLR